MTFFAGRIIRDNTRTYHIGLIPNRSSVHTRVTSLQITSLLANHELAKSTVHLIRLLSRITSIVHVIRLLGNPTYINTNTVPGTTVSVQCNSNVTTVSVQCNSNVTTVSVQCIITTTETLGPISYTRALFTMWQGCPAQQLAKRSVNVNKKGCKNEMPSFPIPQENSPSKMLLYCYYRTPST